MKRDTLSGVTRSWKLRDLALGIALTALVGCSTPAARLLISAAEVGVRAPDSIDGQPGNPFATAFIETLQDTQLPLTGLGTRLRDRTSRISGGLLQPEVGRLVGDGAVTLGDSQVAQRRVALVLIHARYSDGLPVLAGAAHDAVRVGAALRQAGFSTEILVDPARTEREAALQRLARASGRADVALLYVTGHGIMHDEEGYLLDSDFSLGWREEALPEHAIAMSRLGAGMRAARANLVLFGGCRSYEWWE
jgi:hypothetical protein